MRLKIEVELLNACHIHSAERAHRHADETLVALTERDAAISCAAPRLAERSGLDRLAASAPGVVLCAGRRFEISRAVIQPEIKIELAAKLGGIDPEPEHFCAAPVVL